MNEIENLKSQLQAKDRELAELREVADNLAIKTHQFMNPPKEMEITQRVRELNEAYLAYASLTSKTKS